MLHLDVRDVPKLTIAKGLRKRPPQHDPKKEYYFRYKSKKHHLLPHVVKFSGGRSSGMLLFTLLNNKLLCQERGDVIIFNNTSAEHPDTYRFVFDCMQAAQQYGIPFYQVEFQTYEDARQGEWTRLPTYRLVNDVPKSASNKNGFHWQGEVFEELLSWKGYIPNQFDRICTKQLKLEVTRDFLKDWFATKPTIPRLGHYGNTSRIDPDAAHRRHLNNQGGVPKDIFLRKRNYAWKRPHFRPEQCYEDFCSGWKPFENSHLEGKIRGNKAWFGRNGVEYVAFIGLRNDESHRIQRVTDRNNTPLGYEGEHVYMPLADMVVTREDVNEFWKRQEWDLSLPPDSNLSNCVYCFLKGALNLRNIHTHLQKNSQKIEDEFGSLVATPCDISWWNRMESLYGRNLIEEGRDIRSDITRIGFFGNKGLTYEDLENDTDIGQFAKTMLPCDCTE